MTQSRSRNLMRLLGLVAWGAVTLALVFAVVKLSAQLAEVGHNPLEQAAPPSAQAARGLAAGPTQTRDVRLRFVDAEGLRLATETRPIEAGASTVENCRRALDALIQGPQEGLTPILPATTQVRGLYLLEGGELVVDLSRDALPPRLTSTSLEGLLVSGLAATLTESTLKGENDKPVARVRVLIDGAPVLSHIDLSYPYGPGSEWDAAGEPAGNG